MMNCGYMVTIVNYMNALDIDEDEEIFETVKIEVDII